MNILNGESDVVISENVPRIVALADFRDQLRRVAINERNMAILTDETARKAEHVRLLESKKSLEEIVREAQTSSLKTTEIADASAEQNRGIQEITRAMTQLDQGTLVNSATSEKTANSAEELSGQAHALQGTVVELVAVVQGGAKAKAICAEVPNGTPEKTPRTQLKKGHGTLVSLRSSPTQATPMKVKKKAVGAGRSRITTQASSISEVIQARTPVLRSMREDHWGQ